MKFISKDQKIVLGDVVEWENRDLVPHTVTAEDRSFDSKTIEPGRSWKLQTHKKGIIYYKCSFHPTMTARLVIN